MAQSRTRTDCALRRRQRKRTETRRSEAQPGSLFGGCNATNTGAQGNWRIAICQMQSEFSFFCEKWFINRHGWEARKDEWKLSISNCSNWRQLKRKRNKSWARWVRLSGESPEYNSTDPLVFLLNYLVRLVGGVLRGNFGRIKLYLFFFFLTLIR